MNPKSFLGIEFRLIERFPEPAMRCRDVSRAIVAPNGTITEAEIQAHLAACPGCAHRLAQARSFDRLWEATRAEPPSAASWDRAWARIDQELASAPMPTVAEDPARLTSRAPVSRPTIRLAVGFALVAAAASLLLVLMPQRPDGPGMARVRTQAPVFGSLDVPVGHTVLYHVDSAEHRVIQVSEPNPGVDEEPTYFTQRDSGFDADDYFALFGWFEAMPSQVASTSSPNPLPFSTLGSSSPFDPLAH